MDIPADLVPDLTKKIGDIVVLLGKLQTLLGGEETKEEEQKIEPPPKSKLDQILEKYNDVATKTYENQMAAYVAKYETELSKLDEAVSAELEKLTQVTQ